MKLDWVDWAIIAGVLALVLWPVRGEVSLGEGSIRRVT